MSRPISIRPLLQALICLAVTACGWTSLRAEPLTIEQAETLSKATGRPIFAVAGSKS